MIVLIKLKPHSLIIRMFIERSLKYFEIVLMKIHNVKKKSLQWKEKRMCVCKGRGGGIFQSQLQKLN